MTIDRNDGMTCDAFADALAPYLEGELDATSRARVEAHAAECQDCGALLADLQQLSAEAAALPTLEPSHDLWQGIAARIEAPVIPLGARPVQPPQAVSGALRSRLARYWRPGMAAAALVVVTAGVTYVATRASLAQRDVVVVTPAAADRTAPAQPTDASASIAQLVQGQARLAQADSLRAIERSVDQSPIKPRPGPERSAGALLVSNADAAASAVDSLYGQEIARLRTIIARRSASLDPATVAIIEQNLGIIDSAIVRSRSALRRDPASGFLNEQLTSALERKVELLRTAATLPARS